MQRLLHLNKFLLRRSAATAAESGGFSYDAHLRPLSRSLEPVPSSLVLRESFQQRLAGSGNFSFTFCNWFFMRQILGRRTYASTSGITSHLAVGAQLLKFSFLQRKGFGAWKSSGFWRSYGRNMPTSDEVVLGLIGTNVAIYFLWQFADLSFMRKHFVISLENLKSGSLHTMLTSAFSHSELDHLVTNMIGLYFFGTNISRLFGPAFLLKLYVAGALGGSVFFLLHRAYLESTNPFHWRAHALGASAAVNAIILLDVFLFPKNIYYVNLVIPVPAILMGDDNISGSAHMGGAFVALLAWVALKKGWF
ncbi:hypothetical protein KFK09_016068 [Dendrobium nobile]|uniref:Peptidase S54 rhomboid domain-containing protein n=1 Tax=Dendrobium nobile TaxID=94219 RepID=A0A8T3B3Q0_DENNO|nr:hypothetical protein KFK09_016068 [Dendrobium nobile]